MRTQKLKLVGEYNNLNYYYLIAKLIEWVADE